MPSLVYNIAKEQFANGTLDWDDASTWRVLLVTATYAANADHNFVSDVTNELAGGTYARQTLTTRTVTKDTANDRAVLDAADTTFAGLTTAPAGGIAAAAVIYKRVGADDTTPGDDVLVAYIDHTDHTTDGTDFVIQWSAAGIVTLT